MGMQSMAFIEIKKYVLAQYSGASATGLIYLYDGQNKHIGNAYFIREENSLPMPKQDASGFVALYFYDNAFAFVVDLLRNEKPCYLAWYGSSGAIVTSAEAVGEGDLPA